MVVREAGGGILDFLCGLATADEAPDISPAMAMYAFLVDMGEKCRSLKRLYCQTSKIFQLSLFDDECGGESLGKYICIPPFDGPMTKIG
jgi:hypothetical protein